MTLPRLSFRSKSDEPVSCALPTGESKIYIIINQAYINQVQINQVQIKKSGNRREKNAARVSAELIFLINGEI